MSYSARCMHIGMPLNRAMPGRANETYKLGHRDARHAAAEIAAEADATIAELVAALAACPYGLNCLSSWDKWNKARLAALARVKGQA